jgi:hypothetical protein
MTQKDMDILKRCLEAGADDARAVLEFLHRGEEPPIGLIGTLIVNLEVSMKKIKENGRLVLEDR